MNDEEQGAPPDNPESAFGPPKAEGVETQKWPRWISVTEALPVNINDEVLYFDGEEISTFIPETGHNKLHRAAYRCEQFGVTHWMRLPEPPKQGEADSVGRGNAANPPPDKPNSSGLAAAAEDVAGEMWTERGAGVYEGFDKLIACAETPRNATIIAYAHNSCVSRLQEQIKTAKRFHEREHELNVAAYTTMLARAEEAEAKLAAQL